MAPEHFFFFFTYLQVNFFKLIFCHHYVAKSPAAILFFLFVCCVVLAKKRKEKKKRKDICVMFSFTVSVCVNKGLVSLMMKESAQSLSLFSMYSLLKTPLHFIHFKITNRCFMMEIT